MSQDLNLGMIGLDTSHVTAFTELLHDKNHPYHVPGGRVMAAFPGGSEDFDLSRNRVAQFTETLAQQYGVKMMKSVAEVALHSDAIFLESVDGRVHRAQFEEIVSLGKPIFIDKPFALTSGDAAAMIQLAEKYRTPIMSCSALRFSEPLKSALNDRSKGEVIGIDMAGPMTIESTQPGLFWYGIHLVEVLYAVLGRGCRRIEVITNADHDLVVAEWENGRIGTIRGNRKGNTSFVGTLHREMQSVYLDISGSQKPFYASLLEQIMDMFRTHKSPIDTNETFEIIQFIEAANKSRQSGLPVAMAKVT